MTKEQIEKAANAYIDDFLNDHIDYTIINNEEDNYEAGRNHALYEFGADIFKTGVEWCTNSVWHDANEKPSGLFLILMDNEEGWLLGTRTGNTTKRWAYVNDLLPKDDEQE